MAQITFLIAVSIAMIIVLINSFPSKKDKQQREVNEDE